MLAKDIPRADDLFIGTWVNGMDSTQILWMFKEKIPIFIIHTLTSHEQSAPDICSLPVAQGFVAGSEAKYLDASHNSYEHVAIRQGQIQSGFVEEQYINHDRGMEKAQEAAIKWSFSRCQGCIGLPDGSAPTIQINERHPEESMSTSSSQSTQDKFKLPALNRTMIEKGWVARIIPL